MSVHDDVMKDMKEMAEKFAADGIKLQMPPPSGNLLNTRYTDMDFGKMLAAEFDFDPRFRNPIGTFQGGFLCGAFDEVFGPLTYMAARRPAVANQHDVHPPLFGADVSHDDQGGRRLAQPLASGAARRGAFAGWQVDCHLKFSCFDYNRPAPSRRRTAGNRITTGGTTMALKRTSTAVWNGDGMTGKGALDTQSGAFKSQPYSFKTRFADETGKSGTNPEELIAAAHSGCFTMALAFALKEAGFVADELKTNAVVTIDKVGAGFRITGIDLDLSARIPDITNDRFQQVAQTAKANCPVSVALSSVPVALKATLL
jgi:osmotically inducible protein OsmC